MFRLTVDESGRRFMILFHPVDSAARLELSGSPSAFSPEVIVTVVRAETKPGAMAAPS